MLKSKYLVQSPGMELMLVTGGHFSYELSLYRPWPWRHSVPEVTAPIVNVGTDEN